MTGGPQKRFCDGCRKHVYNLSEMSRREGEALLTQTNGKVCVYFYPDADGAPLPREAVPAELPLTTRPRPSLWRRAWAAALSGLVAVTLSALGGAEAAVAKHHPAGKSAGHAPKVPRVKTPPPRSTGGIVPPRTPPIPPTGGKPTLPPPVLGGIPVIQPAPSR